MSPSVALDPAVVRPLTSKEIATVLAGIVGGVTAAAPKMRAFVAGVLETVIRKERARDTERLVIANNALVEKIFDITPSWALAFSATVSGLRTWCDPADVETALQWMAERIDLVCDMGAHAPSY